MRPDSPPIDDEAAEFIGGSSLLFLLSGNPAVAPDVSPRGDGPGFVQILDQRSLLLPDRVGNNRIDSIRNVLADPRLALVFIRGGDARILAVHGMARISTDPLLLQRFVVNARLPRSVMVIDVDRTDLTATSAFDRSGFWKPEAGQMGSDFSLGAALAGQIGGAAGVAETEKLVADNYKSELY